MRADHEDFFRSTACAFLLALILLPALPGCESQEAAPEAVVMDAAAREQWEIALVEMRIEKNERFADPEQTPLPAQRLQGFEGLNYYYPEPKLVFEVPFRRASDATVVELEKRKGEKVPYQQRGTVSFRYRGRNHTLTVFGPAEPDAEDFYLLPFTDLSNADETYAGGRYLDLDPAPDGTVTVDFNYAYNPLCDYDAERYNCVLPPPENHLPFRVEAGEQRFDLEH